MHKQTERKNICRCAKKGDKHFGKRVFSCLLALLLVLTALPLTVWPAAAETWDGSFGIDMTWSLDSESGILTICGSGNMRDWAEFEYSPWYKVRDYVKSVVIQEGITSIGKYAFYECTNLTDIAVPNSVRDIGNYSFSYCQVLQEFNFPDALERIGEGAFYGCSGLTEISLPYTELYFGEEAFSHCTGLVKVTLPEQISYSISPRMFMNCSALKEVIMPKYISGNISGNAYIGMFAFAGCSSLTSIVIPDSVTGIDNGAFSGCSSLEAIQFPDNLYSIGDSAFSGCSKLANVTIPDGVKTIGGYAFQKCTGLNAVNLGNSVTEIGEGAFSGSENLNSIVIPDSVKTIDPYAVGYYYVPYPADCYNKIPDFIIYGFAGSAAETYAAEHEFQFIELQKITNTEKDISVLENVVGSIPEEAQLRIENLGVSINKIVYNISLVKGNVEIQPTAPVTVKIPVPATMDGAQCKVYRQGTDETYTDMHATYQDGYMVFTTDHFSIYVLTTGDPNAAPTYTLGDVNGDGKVNAVDARWVLQAASGARTFDATQTAAADVNGDGKINAVDARWILQVASGARVL